MKTSAIRDLILAAMVTAAVLGTGMGHAHAAGARLSLHLEAPATIGCDGCIDAQQRQHLYAASRLLVSGEQTTERLALALDFSKHGARIGTDAYTGQQIDLQPVPGASGSVHYLAL